MKTRRAVGVLGVLTVAALALLWRHREAEHSQQLRQDLARQGEAAESHPAAAKAPPRLVVSSPRIGMGGQLPKFDTGPYGRQVQEQRNAAELIKLALKSHLTPKQVEQVKEAAAKRNEVYLAVLRPLQPEFAHVNDAGNDAERQSLKDRAGPALMDADMAFRRRLVEIGASKHGSYEGLDVEASALEGQWSWITGHRVLDVPDLGPTELAKLKAGEKIAMPPRLQ